MNRHPNKPLTCTVNFQAQPLNGAYSALVLSGDSPEAFNSIEHPDRVVPQKTKFAFNQGVVELPPHSLTILKVKRPTAKPFKTR